MKASPKNQRGFTLIEVIITIILFALAGTIVFTYLGNVLTRSHEPIVLARDLAEAKEALEEFASEYHRYRAESGYDWDDFKAALTDAGYSDDLVDGNDHPDFDGLDFEVIELSITRGDHTLTTLFSE